MKNWSVFKKHTIHVPVVPRISRFDKQTGKLGNLHWCTCASCRPISATFEGCKCYQKYKSLRDYWLGNRQCICLSDKFEDLCLTIIIFRNSCNSPLKI